MGFFQWLYICFWIPILRNLIASSLSFSSWGLVILARNRNIPHETMSFFSDMRHTPAATKPPGSSGGEALGGVVDLQTLLMNLSVVKARMDFLHKFLSESVNNNVLLGQPQMQMVASEIGSAIQQIIVNGAAVMASINSVVPGVKADESKEEKKGKGLMNPDPDPENLVRGLVSPKVEKHVDDGLKSEEDEIIELDAVELLAEHAHFCEICGKGFKRDANLRMHMRAHGNQFKTPEALAKPGKGSDLIGGRVRFSCPFVGCNRNKQHKKFRSLKSAICVKNHFKRSHCPKMYCCTRCNKKSFSVMADLKTHLKHCGESKWKCSCGTNFSRKDKLFGHIALFEGHMPAVVDDAQEEKGGGVTAPDTAMAVDVEEEVITDSGTNNGSENKDHQYTNGLLFDTFDSVDDYCYQDLLNSPVSGYSLGYGVEGFFDL